MAIEFDDKDPNESLFRQVNWEPRLGGDTIAASAWTLPAGITNDADTFDDTSTTIRLGGGTAGKKYSMLNRITTAASQVMDQTVTIRIRTK